MATTTAINPWERQPKETDVAFEAFAVYRDMGPERSVSKVAKKCSKNASLLNRWSSTHSWVSRSAAFDNEVDRRMREDLIKGVTTMRKKHVDIANAMIAKAVSALKILTAEEMSMRDITLAVDVAAKLERLSRGESTEKTESKTEIAGGISILPQIYLPEKDASDAN